MLKFTKMNGAGNDFVLLDNRDLSLQLSAGQIVHLCDRHRGVGADGVLVVEPPEKDADFRMRYYNRDGGEVEMCGNGARCFARFARRFVKSDEIRFETMAGVVSATIEGENVRLHMGEPRDLQLRQPLEVAGRTLEVHSVNTGVPHAVVFVEDLEAVPVRELGASLRYHKHFAPKGTNANFIVKTGPQSLAIRTYERGVEDETLACGTGVIASAIVLHELIGATLPLEVKVRGGDSLMVDFEELAGTYRDVTLTGPADIAFTGEIDL